MKHTFTPGKWNITDNGLTGDEKKIAMKKFYIGQIVNFTNDNGVNWGDRIIVGYEHTSYGPAYYIHPHDAPWFAVPERCLTAQKEADHASTTD